MRPWLPFSITVAALLLATTAGVPSAATAAPPVPPKAWTAGDILLAESAGSFAISPDGQRAVGVKSRMDEEKGERVSNLFLSRLAGEAAEVQLPLEAALARKGFAQQGVLCGRTVKGKLVPEAVAFEGLQVARLGVTRAQYAAFDPKRRFPAGTGNLTASGITFDEAKAYAATLASLTGEPWRCRAGALYGGSREDENTLDLWAGYAPNPEDAERVRRKAADLGGVAPLLEEAGRHAGRGEGRRSTTSAGTVPEWTVGADGKGVLAGGSADLPAGTTGPSTSAGEGWCGPRVVKGRAAEEGGVGQASLLG